MHLLLVFATVFLPQACFASPLSERTLFNTFFNAYLGPEWNDPSYFDVAKTILAAFPQDDNVFYKDPEANKHFGGGANLRRLKEKDRVAVFRSYLVTDYDYGREVIHGIDRAFLDAKDWQSNSKWVNFCFAAVNKAVGYHPSHENIVYPKGYHPSHDIFPKESSLNTTRDQESPSPTALPNGIVLPLASFPGLSPFGAKSFLCSVIFSSGALTRILFPLQLDPAHTSTEDLLQNIAQKKETDRLEHDAKFAEGRRSAEQSYYEQREKVFLDAPGFQLGEYAQHFNWATASALLTLGCSPEHMKVLLPFLGDQLPLGTLDEDVVSEAGVDGFMEESMFVSEADRAAGPLNWVRRDFAGRQLKPRNVVMTGGTLITAELLRNFGVPPIRDHTVRVTRARADHHDPTEIGEITRFSHESYTCTIIILECTRVECVLWERKTCTTRARARLTKSGEFMSKIVGRCI